MKLKNHWKKDGKIGNYLLSAGKILAELDKKRKSIDFRDVMVAGIILKNNKMLYTRNTEHFKRIKGVNLYQTL